MNGAAKISDFLVQSNSLSEVVLDAVDFAICNGVLMRTRSKPRSSEVVQHVPFTLCPSPVPKHLYEQAIAVQKDFNILMNAVSQDVEFLKSSLAAVIEHDDFIRKLHDICVVSQQTNSKKPSIAFIRSDYMFHKPDENPPQLKQIEVNMISASGAIGTEKLKSVHNYTLRQAGFSDISTQLPQNNALPNLAQAIVKAWNIYGNNSAIVIFIVVESDQYIFDHKTLIFKIQELQPNIRFKCYTFAQVSELGSVDVDGKLMIKQEETAVVYFRAGYSPDHYPTEQEWDARLLLERSNAINCPSVAHQLVGCKKIQQVLSQRNMLERFIKDKDSINRMRETFVKFDGLEMSAAGDEAVAKVLQNPAGYVLKPQRESGGNNLYNDDLVAKLKEISGDSRRCVYVAMEKIHPMPIQSLIVCSEDGYDDLEPIECVSELGIFGYIISKGGDIMYNSIAGHLMRTKPSHVEDGGILLGVTALDSPLLY